jgi:hypothetical protein
MLSLVIVLSLFALSATAVEQPWQIGEKVQTSSGTVIGHPSQARPDVSEYLGIPYVQPPIGKLRWAAPVPFRGVETILADKYVRSIGHSY